MPALTLPDAGLPGVPGTGPPWNTGRAAAAAVTPRRHPLVLQQAAQQAHAFAVAAGLFPAGTWAQLSPEMRGLWLGVTHVVVQAVNP